MKNKLYRIISPVTLLVVLALDAATVAYAVFAVKKLIQNVSVYSVLFAIIDLFAIVVAVLVSKYVVSQGIVFGDETFEFTAHDENNVFNYDDVENIKIHKDTKASLKKNFNDRQSQVIITLKNGGVVTVDIGLTSMKKLKKIENEINYNDLLLEFSRKDKTDIPTAIAYSTVDSANRINANAIVCSTMTGLTAKKISHFRPSAPVIAISPIEKTVSGLTINYGIIPMKVPMLESTDEIIEKSTSVAKEALNLQKKDRIVIAGSFPLNVEYTNFLRIEEIKE